jgi:hypothetical protein
MCSRMVQPSIQGYPVVGKLRIGLGSGMRLGIALRLL